MLSSPDSSSTTTGSSGTFFSAGGSFMTVRDFLDVLASILEERAGRF
jgi:hypothetical protein